MTLGLTCFAVSFTEEERHETFLEGEAGRKGPESCGS